MRTLDCKTVVEVTSRLCREANCVLEPDVVAALEMARREEISPTGKDVLGQLLENAQIAVREEIPLCQDTGIAVVFVEVGQDVRLVDGSLEEAVVRGVREGYEQGYLRKSVVADPLNRVNTGDNTPPVIHWRVVSGDRLKISVMPKGAGSENMSALKMLKPAEGLDGVKRFILETVSSAGPNPCPPLVVGVGLGGTLEKAALLAKEALLRPVGTKNPVAELAGLEESLRVLLNGLGIGPMGLGGRVTVLAVHILTYPTHIAMLPVAVNLNCHVVRHKTAVL
ncbi:MAG: fumarate hydratase [Bacillota bacterium]